MTNSSPISLDKTQKSVIFAITFGNVLEWYDFYLYIFLARTLSEVFFGDAHPDYRLFGIIAFFAIAFVARPVGGLFFGRLGDLIGRKKAFILSMVVMASATFCMGFLPVYSQVGILAPILLAMLRILQTLPSGGELPGAFCYLYEAGTDHKKFMSSFAAIGNQIGIAIAALECYFLKSYLSYDLLLSWGWRFSFILGGLIGLSGIYLRYRLHETRAFQEISRHHKLTKRPILEVFKQYKGKIVRGISFGAAQTVTFHFITVLFPVYFFHLKGTNETKSLLATLVLLAITTLPLPFYGWLSERYNPKALAIGACTLLLLLLYPLYIAVHDYSAGALYILGFFALFLSCITALWPYFLSNLFPTSLRYTGVALSFNIGDGILGGLSTLFTIYSLSAEKNLAIFIWIAAAGCILSILSCLKIRLPKR